MKMKCKKNKKKNAIKERPRNKKVTTDKIEKENEDLKRMTKELVEFFSYTENIERRICTTETERQLARHNPSNGTQ
jgi:hypothetical protein